MDLKAKNDACFVSYMNCKYAVKIFIKETPVLLDCKATFLIFFLELHIYSFKDNARTVLW